MSIDTNTSNMINKFVIELMKRNQMFTAWDVTNFLRTKNVKTLTGDAIWHSNVKSIVEGIDLSRYNYEKVLIQINNVDKAYLYKNLSSNTDDYSLTIKNSSFDVANAKNTSKNTSNTSSKSTSKSVTNNVSNTTLVKVDSRNRITVESRFVKGAGFNVGDKILVYRSGNRLILSLKQYKNPAFKVVTSLTVDSYYNLRMPKTSMWIDNYGMAKNSTYLVDKANNTVKIDFN